MELLFTAHAVERMQSRKVLPEDIQRVIDQPDGVVPQTMDKEIRHKKLRARTDNDIAVVLVVRPAAFEVLTVMNHFRRTR